MNATGAATATFAAPAVTGVTVTPGPTASVTIGTSQQFAASVTGNSVSNSAVTWMLAGPQGSRLDPGTLSATGLYTTPYPAPPTVTITATSIEDPTISGSATISLVAPPATAAPALSVDTSSITHVISPEIYGMNNYQLTPGTEKASHLSIDRWGGDAATSYNYLTDTINSAGDYYFENFPGSAANPPDGSQFNSLVAADIANGTRTMGTIPLIGFSPLRNHACSFSVAKYGAQKATDPYNADCGNGVLLNGSQIMNDPADAYTPVDETFAANWVKFLVGKFGTAKDGGVAIYDLDNEPEWWDGVHIDVHPKPFTYDELTSKGIAYAKAIKSQDPTAQVSGPVISYWMDFFYSKKDIESGWSTAPYVPNDNPVDRLAHGDVPLIEYYLQQFKNYEDANHLRLLDYLDLHAYFVASNLAFSQGGDTATQQARLNSTRVFWDPTYTDPAYTDPDDPTPGAKPYPPQIIKLMQGWVANDYPGTKTAITEYNWGGQEHISGALAQVDILGIFGREGLDLGTLWGPPDPVTQVPGLIAFELFRNYDGAGAQFGDQALTSVSSNQGQLSIYGAKRSSDDAITVMVVNKSYGDLTGSVTLEHIATKAGAAKAYLYSDANLASIVAQSDVILAMPKAGSSTATTTFPAQSITLLVIPKL